MLRYTLYIIMWASVLVAVWSGCTGCRPGSYDEGENLCAYSELLSIEDYGPYTLCRIRDPWHTEAIVRQYLLVPSAAPDWDEQARQRAEAQLGAVTVLRTPLRRLAITSSCHAWLLHELDAFAAVRVLCDTGYVRAPEVRRLMHAVDAGGQPLVADGGSSMAPNAEVVVASGCDAIWISPFESMALQHLTQLPAEVIYCADYLETSPLGRAEWMRFYGRLVDRAAQADSLFADVADRYNALVRPAADGPRLLAEVPYGATWYVPGGCSTSSRLYQHAGYVYPWSDDPHAGSLSLSREAVLARAQDCDLWLIKYEGGPDTLTLDAFLAQHNIYGQFKAAQLGKVWGCNTSTSDLFDVTPFRPDTLLRSLRLMDGRFYQRLLTSRDSL